MQEVLIQNLHEPLEAVYLKFAYKRRHFGSSLVTTPPTHSMTKSCSFSTRELRAYARASCRYDVENGTRSLARLVDSCKTFFSILGFWVHLIVFGV